MIFFGIFSCIEVLRMQYPVLYYHTDDFLTDQYMASYLPEEILGFITQAFAERFSPVAKWHDLCITYN